MKSVAFIAGLFATTAAVAADLPARSAPVAPVRQVVYEPTYPFFVGVHVGGTFLNSNYNLNDANVNGNLRGGVELNRFTRVEVNYDYSHDSVSQFRTNTVTGNLIGQYRFGPVVPYVLGGIGYRWSGFKDEFVYNFGGGVRYEFTSRIEADLRYRYITDRDRRFDQSVVTAGLNYKF